MSQYRNEQDAARARIDALEEKLAERDAELRAQKVAEAEREAEVARLRRELQAASPPRPIPPPHSMAPRLAAIALLAVAICVITGAVTMLMMRTAGPEPQQEQAPIPQE